MDEKIAYFNDLLVRLEEIFYHELSGMTHPKVECRNRLSQIKEYRGEYSRRNIRQLHQRNHSRRSCRGSHLLKGWRRYITYPENQELYSYPDGSQASIRSEK